jgi:hypothetical protein
MPLLHRPTFEKSVSEGLHHTNAMFGATLLLVCAHGARYSDEPRVLAAESPRSAGWRWFEQVNILRKSLYHRTNLYELQMHAVSCSSPIIAFGQLFAYHHHSETAICLIRPHKRNAARDMGPDRTCCAYVAGGRRASETAQESG